MKHLIKKLINKCGYDIWKIPKSHFTINGIKYLVGRCAIGEPTEGEIAAKTAIRMIKEKQLENLKVLDICCGIGIIGLTIFSTFRNSRIVDQLVLSDINIFNIESLIKILSINNLDPLVGNRIHCHLSDGLTHIPNIDKFDIIISNPPHHFEQPFKKLTIPLSPNKLGTYDQDWSFHKSFYEKCHHYLKENGEVWFFENNSASNEGLFLPLIEKNQHLKFVRKFEEPLDSRYFWMISKKINKQG